MDQDRLVGMLKMNNSCRNNHVSILLEQCMIYNYCYNVNPFNESKNPLLSSQKLCDLHPLAA